jgi:hypothetical protein
MADKKQSGGGSKIGRNKIKGQTFRNRTIAVEGVKRTRSRKKVARIARDAERKNPRTGCGHGKRYQGSLGCSKCRRKNGATMHPVPS